MYAIKVLLGLSRETFLNKVTNHKKKMCIWFNFLKIYNIFMKYSFRCGHCQRLAPEWKKAASELKGKVKVAMLDATVHTAMGQR